MSENNMDNSLWLEEKLRDLPEPEIDPVIIAQTVSSVQRMARGKQRESSGRGAVLRFKNFFNNQLIYAAAAFVIGIILSASVLSSSASALPGTWLYPIKLISEQIAYALKMTPSGKAELRITFSEERLKEIEKTYDLKGKIDKEILESLLAEANNALLLSKKTKEPQKDELNKKIEKLNDRQIAVLSALGENAAGPQKELLNVYLNRCQNLMPGRNMRMLRKNCNF
ncbi:MAG: DUF5667 domain-containing protein [Candidatus Margulisbacteria bacterium]|nr:DUF5667 domain-containing protein [Candidatus Margulisiibacteriota bacterium]